MSNSTRANAAAGSALLLTRFGDAAAVALPAAACCALPAGYRAAVVGASVTDVLLVAAAVSLAVLWPLLLLRVRLVRGWRVLVGAGATRDLALALGVCAALAVGCWVLLGAALKAVTHHHALGGVTFGVFAVAAAGGAALVTRRLLGPLRWLMGRGLPRRLLVAVAWSSVALLVALASWRGAAGAANHSARAALLDGALLAVIGGVAAANRRWLRALAAWRVPALAAALTLLVVAGARVEAGPGAIAVRHSGGLAAVMLQALQRWSDRDADGYGAHFGGGDCDEGDASRHPGAIDRMGDGLDSDCDGRDAPAGVAPVSLSASAAARGPSSVRAWADAGTGAAGSAGVGSAGGSSSAGAAREQHDGGAAASSKPDIILVTLDTVRADHTSAYGYDKPTTPVLERLASRGTLFEHAYATGSNTQRALMPIFSGRTLSATDASRQQWPRLRASAETVAERLGAAGYRSAGVSSFTWLRKDLGYAQGFDHFDETPFRDHHPERMVTGVAAATSAIAAYRELAAGSDPLFLWLQLFDAHAKYLEHPGIHFGKGERARYDGEIAFADAQLGKLVVEVRAGPRAGRTVWIIHGTQGEAFGEHGASGHGGALAFDEVLRVPLVVVAPGGRAQRYARDAVSMLDVAPTVLAYAGGSAKNVHGRSLRRIVDGELNLERPPVLAFATHRTVVIDWPLKLIVMRRRDKHDRRMLFDLKRDAGEQHDVAADHPADVARLDKLRR